MSIGWLSCVWKFSKCSKWKQCIFLHMYFCALGRCISASPAGPSWHSATTVRGTERGEHSHRAGQAPAALPLLWPHVLIMEAAESQPQQPGKVLNWEVVPWYVCKVPGPFCLGKNSLMANVLCSLTQEEQESQQMDFYFYCWYREKWLNRKYSDLSKTAGRMSEWACHSSCQI